MLACATRSSRKVNIIYIAGKTFLLRLLSAAVRTAAAPNTHGNRCGCVPIRLIYGHRDSNGIDFSCHEILFTCTASFCDVCRAVKTTSVLQAAQEVMGQVFPLATVPAPRRTPMFTVGTAESPPCWPVKPGFCFWRPGSVQQGFEGCLNHGATYAWVLSVCEALLLSLVLFFFC